MLRCAILVLSAATFVRGDLIPIVNPSFESISRPLEVGEQSNGAGGSGTPVATRFPFGAGVSWANPVAVPGWRTYTHPVGSTNTVYAGVLNPPNLPGQFAIAGHDGNYLAAVQVAQIGQTLTTLLQPSTHYKLSFLGGIALHGSDYHLGASLIVVPDQATLPIENQPGVVRLVISTGAIPPPNTFGTMLPYSIEYTSPAVLPSNLAGKFLGIQMYGSDGIPRVLYDNFVLEATPVPVPATALMIGMTGAACFGRRRGPAGLNAKRSRRLT